MSEAERELAALEQALQEEFSRDTRFTSTAGDFKTSDEVRQLIMSKSNRGRVPLTRTDFVVTENPARVEWEREVRNFLRELRPGTRYRGHKVNAPMVFEWVTGKTIKQIQEEEKVDTTMTRGGQATGSANMHLRHINVILKEYFGEPRKTTILGRPVGKAYDVPKGFRTERRKPMCLTLWPEYDDGVLDL